MSIARWLDGVMYSSRWLDYAAEMNNPQISQNQCIFLMKVSRSLLHMAIQGSRLMARLLLHHLEHMDLWTVMVEGG